MRTPKIFLLSLLLVVGGRIDNLAAEDSSKSEEATAETPEETTATTGSDVVVDVKEKQFVSVYMKPFYIDLIPVPNLLEAFKNSKKTLEDEFAKGLSELLPSLDKEDIFIHSIINPSSSSSNTLLEKSKRAVKTTKLFFHEIIAKVIGVKLRNFRTKGDPSVVYTDTNKMYEDFLEFEKKKERVGFTRIEWFMVDQKNQHLEHVKKVFSDIETLINNMESNFWKNTSFGKGVKKLLENNIVMCPKIPVTKIKLALSDFALLKSQKTVPMQLEELPENIPEGDSVDDVNIKGKEEEEKSCYVYGVDYYGNDIKKIENGSINWAHECQQECRYTDGCEYWTYNSANNWCYLKDKNAINAAITSSDAKYMTSGSKDCSDMIEFYPDSPCNLEGADFLGNDLEFVGNISNLAECSNACMIRSLCYFYTFDPLSKSCYTKKSEGLSGWITSKWSKNLVSGAKRCTVT